MKWGVRRYQNKDGTLTNEGKARNTARNNIVRNRPYTDDVTILLKHYHLKKRNFQELNLIKIGQKIWTNVGRTGQIAIATRNDKKYRGKGYASKEVEKAVKWADRYGKYTIDELEWLTEKNNTGSRRLAEKYGFKEDDNRGYDDYVRYTRKVNK